YSWRVFSDFFILPRAGLDGYYSTLTTTPKSSRDVDDNVYNAFRLHRNSFAFLQGLFWYVPFFNDIFYLRARGTYDIGNSQFSHASARPGFFLIFRSVEMGVFGDASYYAATVNARPGSDIDKSA